MAEWPTTPEIAKKLAEAAFGPAWAGVERALVAVDARMAETPVVTTFLTDVACLAAGLDEARAEVLNALAFLDHVQGAQTTEEGGALRAALEGAADAHEEVAKNVEALLASLAPDAAKATALGESFKRYPSRLNWWLGLALQVPGVPGPNDPAPWAHAPASAACSTTGPERYPERTSSR